MADLVFGSSFAANKALYIYKPAIIMLSSPSGGGQLVKMGRLMAYGIVAAISFVRGGRPRAAAT